jgi:hypothetical protein
MNVSAKHKSTLRDGVDRWGGDMYRAYGTGFDGVSAMRLPT